MIWCVRPGCMALFGMYLEPITIRLYLLPTNFQLIMNVIYWCKGSLICFCLYENKSYGN